MKRIRYTLNLLQEYLMDLRTSLGHFLVLAIISLLFMPLTGCSTTRETVPETSSTADDFTDRLAMPPAEKNEQGNEGVFMIADEMPFLIGGLASVQSDVVYPEALIRAGIEGRVFVQFVVDEEGIPGDIVVVRSPHHLMEQPAIDAVAAATFKPGKRDGVAVPVKMSLPITFKLPRTDN